MNGICSRCGEGLVEVSLVPRTYPLDRETGDLDTMDGGDEAYWEGETVLGVGCVTDTCPNWQGQYGIRVSDTGAFTVVPALSLAEATAPQHTVRGKAIGPEGVPYGTTHDMDCPGCAGTSFSASPRSEAYWAS